MEHSLDGASYQQCLPLQILQCGLSGAGMCSLTSGVLGSCAHQREQLHPRLCGCVRWEGPANYQISHFPSIFTCGHPPKVSATSWRDAKISKALLNSSRALCALNIDGGILHYKKCFAIQDTHAGASQKQVGTTLACSSPSIVPWCMAHGYFWQTLPCGRDREIDALGRNPYYSNVHTLG